MTYRERFRLTLEHRDVDRPPMDLGATDMTGIDGGPRRLALLLDIPVSAGSGTAAADEAVLDALDIDIRSVGGILEPASPLARQISDTERVDAWGITYRFNGHHDEAVGRPLAGTTIDDLRRYRWPDPDDIDRDVVREAAARARWLFEQTPYVVCGRHPSFGVLELGCWMCGFDDFLYRLAAEPDFVREFFRIIVAYQKRVDEIYYGALGRWLHFTTSGDDFGSQAGPLLGPSMFRDLVLPCLRERIRHITEFSDAVFFHHSCGSIRLLIPDLIDAGVRILNPLQPNAAGMEPEGLKADFGSSLVFYGGVDTQWLLPRGTPEEVTAVTRHLVRTLGEQGGYVLSAAHHIQSDVPPENVVAMYREAARSREESQ